MKKIIAFFAIAFLFASCGSLNKNAKSPFQGKTLFTHEMRQRIEEFGDIKKVQFYTTRRIKMTRVSTSEGIEITSDGKVVEKVGDREEEIVLERELPGICVEAFEDRMKISFSEGTFLIFKRDFVGTYSLVVERDVSGTSKVQYGTEMYKLAAGSDEAKLSINKQYKKDDKEEEREESGRTIGGGL